MGTLNSAFFYVTDKIIDLQAFFWKEAWAIGRTVLIIALCLAAVNYALSGTGLKESLVKIGKAFVFFVVIMGLYPRVVSHITAWTFEKAQASTYLSVEYYLNASKDAMAESADRADNPIRDTYATAVMKSKKVSEDADVRRYFSSIMVTRERGQREYTCVAPAAVLEIILLIAGGCFDFADKASKGVPDFGQVLTGLLCGFFVIFTGILAVLEYLLAFIEFMFITSVGIILLPLSLWEGSKFMAEKLIGAITGFFIKLLFCNICIFFMLYGFISLAKGYAEIPFTGRPDEILIVIFISLLFFYLCKSAPALAQSLLTGTPSLNAAGAISAAKGAIAGAGAALGATKAVGGFAAGAAAKTAFAGAGALAQAGASRDAVKTLGGSAGQQAGAFMSSLGGSAKQAVLSAGGDLARSLISGGSGGSGGSAGSGINRHSQRQRFLQERDADGTKKTFGEYGAGRREAGTGAGENYMLKQEERKNLQTEKLTNPGQYYAPPDKD
jgi:hypothetical protein